MKFDCKYDRFISLSGWLNALLYALPGAAFLAICYFTGIDSELWTPTIIIYGIGAIAKILGEGLQSINTQMVVISDRWENELQQHGPTD